MLLISVPFRQEMVGMFRWTCLLSPRRHRRGPSITMPMNHASSCCVSEAVTETSPPAVILSLGRCCVQQHLVPHSSIRYTTYSVLWYTLCTSTVPYTRLQSFQNPPRPGADALVVLVQPDGCAMLIKQKDVVYLYTEDGPFTLFST